MQALLVLINNDDKYWRQVTIKYLFFNVISVICDKCFYIGYMCTPMLSHIDRVHDLVMLSSELAFE